MESTCFSRCSGIHSSNILVSSKKSNITFVKYLCDYSGNASMINWANFIPRRPGSLIHQPLQLSRRLRIALRPLLDHACTIRSRSGFNERTKVVGATVAGLNQAQVIDVLLSLAEGISVWLPNICTFVDFRVLTVSIVAINDGIFGTHRFEMIALCICREICASLAMPSGFRWGQRFISSDNNEMLWVFSRIFHRRLIL